MKKFNFQHIEATNEHCDIVKKIAFSVMDEYGIRPETIPANYDLNNLEWAFKNGYFGLIQNGEKQFVGTFGLYRLNETTGEIRKMYLLPEARGYGIGQWMVHFLLKKAKNLGYQRVELETDRALKEAVSLYRKMGFTQIENCKATSKCDLTFYLELN